LIPTWICLRERIIFDEYKRLFFQTHKNRGGPVVGGKDSDGPWLDSHGSIPNIFFILFISLGLRRYLTVTKIPELHSFSPIDFITSTEQ
jgi:hypothetical protein